MSIEDALNQEIKNQSITSAKKWFDQLIQLDQYVGELYSINYETARVNIHDNDRKKVGGIPSLSFLIATRINPSNGDIDFKEEDSSIILLRVMDSAPTFDSAEKERIRLETAQSISGELDKHWDSAGVMDTKTRVYLGYAAVECRIVGTFFLEETDSERNDLGLRFGSDISNYYPNRGLKAYKPTSEALEIIVNYCDPSNLQDHEEKYGTSSKVVLGNVRYASTNRRFQKVDNVSFSIYPADLLSQKTALFGMTRTGKSNTTKIIAKSVYELRYPNGKDKPLRIGQLIFDPNGEYANENVQDKGALKNIWKMKSGVNSHDEVVTYGITTHSNDPDRKLMLINFYTDENIQTGKEIINAALALDRQSIYIKNFLQVDFIKPENPFDSSGQKYRKKVLAYRSLLYEAGFEAPSNSVKSKWKANNTDYDFNLNSTSKLFSENILKALEESKGVKAAEHKMAAKIFAKSHPTWAELATAFKALDDFISDEKSGYKSFNDDYIADKAESWADEDLKKILTMFRYPNGVRQIGAVIEQHSSSLDRDYAEDIYDDLKKGKLVIVDQSSGEYLLNKTTADRVMAYVFRQNQLLFRQGKNPTEILVYLEEAHNILPPSKSEDLSDIWVKTAKEGAKYRIGVIYATQEVSSIQKNILKNTANWFIAHLNNTDETKELCKYYDFADFEASIRRAQDKGFIRVKTMSNLFVVPIQANLFSI